MRPVKLTMAHTLSSTQRAMAELELEGRSNSCRSPRDCCSLANQLTGLMWAFTIAGTVVDPTLSDGADGDIVVETLMRVFAARYFVAILVLWSLAQIVGRVAFFQVVWLAGDLGYSIVLSTLVLVTIEAAAQFVSSALIPRFYICFVEKGRNLGLVSNCARNLT